MIHAGSRRTQRYLCGPELLTAEFAQEPKGRKEKLDFQRSGRTEARSGLAGIELERADGEVEGYHPRPFGCEVGSHFHQHHVSRGPPNNAGRPNFSGPV